MRDTMPNEDRISEIERELNRLSLLESKENDAKWVKEHLSRRERILGRSTDAGEMPFQGSTSDNFMGEDSYSTDAMFRTCSTSDSCLLDFRRASVQEEIPSSNSNAMFPRPSSSSGLKSLVSQLTERKETTRHSAIEKGLMRQLEIVRSEKDRQIADLQSQLRQRDLAIMTLESTLTMKHDVVDTLRDQMMSKDDLVDELRNEVEKLNRKYKQERRRRKSAEV